MTLTEKIQSRLSTFRANQSGTIAIAFALGTLVVLVSAGAAMDFSRIVHTKVLMNDALDAALLSAGRDLADGKKVNAKFKLDFNNFFFANIEGRTSQADYFEITDFTADEATGEVSAEAKADLQMAFMGLFGKDKVTVSTRSEARFSSDKIEIAMMLDVTGSMETDDKIGSLKAAAKDAFDILLPNGGDNNGKVRIGLVPYSFSVNAGQYAKKTTKGKSPKCVTERSGPLKYTDASYFVKKLGADKRAVEPHKNGGLNSNKCPAVKIRPLTNKLNKLKSDVDSYVADGYTAGHLGIAWTYYMLSDKWQSLWPSASDPADYSAKVQKIALLMTDGEFNTYYDGT